MSYAVVTTNLLDLRSAPSHESERASQLFFAEPVQLLSTRRGFARIRQVDGYSGWVDRRLLAEVGQPDFNGWPQNVNVVVAAAKAPVYSDRTGRPIPPHFLLYGTPLRATSVRGGFSSIRIPGGGKVFVKTAHLRPINKTTARSLTGRRLLAEARKFLGVPYLWGGVSPLGFDCSGLVKTLLGAFGIRVPRDTGQQIGVGRKVDRGCIKTGDLLFFERHVGLAIGRTRLLHASRGGGGVRINSLSPDVPGYRADLDRDFNQARRLL